MGGQAYLRSADGDMLGRRVCAWLAMHRVEAGELAAAISSSLSSCHPFSGLRRAATRVKPR